MATNPYLYSQYPGPGVGFGLGPDIVPKTGIVSPGTVYNGPPPGGSTQPPTTVVPTGGTAGYVGTPAPPGGQQAINTAVQTPQAPPTGPTTTAPGTVTPGVGATGGGTTAGTGTPTLDGTGLTSPGTGTPAVAPGTANAAQAPNPQRRPFGGPNSPIRFF